MDHPRFKDHFSNQARDYARYRPDYPDAIFSWLAEQAPTTAAAWDCATGNGQAAFGLAQYFSKVIATDASRRQIENVIHRPKIDFRVCAAEESGLPANDIDLITVAQALHWLDLPAFYPEVTRVLKPGGVIAVWSYQLFRVTPEIDDVVTRFYSAIVGPYWPPERRHVESGYAELNFPFPLLSAPQFEMEAHWQAKQALGYLNTWSAVQRFQRERGENPLDWIRRKLENCWGNESRRVVWPLRLKAGTA